MNGLYGARPANTSNDRIIVAGAWNKGRRRVEPPAYPTPTPPGGLPRDLRAPSGSDENRLFRIADGSTHTTEAWVGLSLFDVAHL